MQAEQRLLIKLSELLDVAGIELDKNKQEQLICYVELIARWNKVHNITAIKDVDEMLTKHVLDSLSLLPFIVHGNLLDVGSGAGLPGVVVAIVRADVTVTVLDSNNKKTQFLNQVKAKLKLNNLLVVHSRIEDFKPSELFHQITSRAFSSVDVFVDKSWMFLAPRGVFLAMKGRREQTMAELDALNSSFAVQSIHELSLQGHLGERNLVVIQKL